MENDNTSTMGNDEEIIIEIVPRPFKNHVRSLLAKKPSRIPDSDDETLSVSTDTSELSVDIPILKQRAVIPYNAMQIQDMEYGRIIFNAEYNRNITRKIINSYDNQINTANDIVETFCDRSKVIQLVIGYTQSGKTGCMVELIRKFINEELIPVENIYIITGLSSKDWLNQCKQRFPKSLEHQIYHNGQMQKFREEVQNKQNVLVIVDEAHMACLKKQTMNSVFKDLNWKLDYMMENDIKLVQFSATPDGIIFALKQPRWPAINYHVHIMNSGIGYYGAKEMMQRGKVKQLNQICGRDRSGGWIADPASIYANICEILYDALSFDAPKYVIFRVLGGYQTYYEENIKQAVSTLPVSLQQNFDCENICEYFMEGNVDDINHLLSITPERITFIFIKEKMKCAQTLEFIENTGNGTTTTKTHNVKKNIGVMIDRWTKGIEAGKSHDSFYIQGYLGRLCGYGMHDVICYTNIDSVNKYEALMENRFNHEILSNIQWNSNSTKGTRNGTKCKKTVNDAEERIDGDWEDDSGEKKCDEPDIVKFKTQEEAKTYYVSYLQHVFGGRGPNKINQRPDGYYESNIRNVTKIYTTQEVFNERRWGLKAGKNNYRYRACYTDINDKNSVEFWIIHVKI